MNVITDSRFDRHYEEARFWQRWGTLGGDIVHYPLMELPYDTYYRDPEDWLHAYSLKTDIYRLSMQATHFFILV